MAGKRCRIISNAKKGIPRPHCALGVRLPCKSAKCRQRVGATRLKSLMLIQRIKVGKPEQRIIDQAAEHYFCSTALGRRPRDFGYFRIKEIRRGCFEVLFRNGSRRVISF